METRAIHEDFHSCSTDVYIIIQKHDQNVCYVLKKTNRYYKFKMVIKTII